MADTPDAAHQALQHAPRASPGARPRAWLPALRLSALQAGAGCGGRPGSSMRRRSVGGTIRGDAGAPDGAAATGTTVSSIVAGAAASGAGSGSSSTTGSSRGSSTTVGRISSTGASATGASATGASSAAGGWAGLIVLIRRGGPSTGAVGFGGSTFFVAGAFFAPPLGGAAVSANMSPLGSEILRWRATRSTNDRATTSSIVLEALFSSMPWSRLSSASTSWLLEPSSSATL